jgi:hypothetical protein
VAKVQYKLEVMDAEGRATGVVKPPAHVALPQGDVRRAELSFPFDLVWLATSANSFRSDAIRAVMPIPESEFARCPDWYLAHLAALLGRVVSLNEVGGYYRVHGANSFEPQESKLDLEHVRDAVRYAEATGNAIGEAACALGLDLPHGRLLSVSDLAYRLISVKLEPDRHPIPGDRPSTLVAEGLKASLRRFDVSPPLRVVFAAWFAVAFACPRTPMRTLAELFVFPERRRLVNRLIDPLHRRYRTGGGAPT